MKTALSDWIRRDGVSVRGRAFESASATGPPLEGEALASRFEEVRHSPSPLESAADLAASLEGFFAAVIALEESAVLVADGARSIPLYYGTGSTAGGSEPNDGSESDDATGPIVSDRGRVVRDAIDAPRNPVTESEFLLTRYVTGPETIWEGVYAVQPGEAVRVSAGEISRRTYRDHWPGSDQLHGDGTAGAQLRGEGPTTSASEGTTTGQTEGVEILRSGLETALDRLERVAGNRPVVVSLSGGYDSRLLAAALVERGREVIAFTFGRSGHPDVEVSREVAAHLGIRWEFCEYSRSAWREWYHDEAGVRYRKRAFGGDALPFLAAWPAVCELLETGRLPSDGVYCPGHAVATPGDRVPRFTGESTTSDARETGCTPERTSGLECTPERASGPEIDPTIEELVEYVLDRHYALWPWDDDRFRRAARERIRRGLLGERDPSVVTDAETAAAAYERWEWRGRLSTFTNGDLRLYEDAGVDWWLPLWDPAYVRAWSRLPFELRANRRAHVALAVDTYGRVADVPASRAGLTDRTLAPLDRLLSLVRYTPARQFSERDGVWDPPFLAARPVWSEYGTHPLAWEGVVEREGYEYLSAYADLYGMRTLAETGRIDLTGVDEDVLCDGRLVLPTSAPREATAAPPEATSGFDEQERDGPGR